MVTQSQQVEARLSRAYLDRFSGIARLYGLEALEAFHDAHFFLVGLGGVGCWVAEALARSGVGELTLIEMDDICVTNSNRQLHALTSNIGKTKLSVIGERLKAINPEIRINPVFDFLSKSNITSYLGEQHHLVIDTIDSVSVKATLAAYCSYLKKRMIMVGASGGKRDPTQVTVADLAFTTADPMLSRVRGQLYRRHNFARRKNRKFRIDAVYSTEQMVYPQADNTVGMNKKALEGSVKLDCSGGFGSSTMVTGSFGFVTAARALERYLEATRDEIVR